MIEVTPNAALQLAQLLKNHTQPGDWGLRLEVERGGCAGMQYAMKIDQARPDDHRLEQDAARIWVDPESMQWIDGSVIDYVNELNDSGFKVNNPKAARNCGCGSSFEPAQSAAAASA